MTAPLNLGDLKVAIAQAEKEGATDKTPMAYKDNNGLFNYVYTAKNGDKFFVISYWAEDQLPNGVNYSKLKETCNGE